MVYITLLIKMDIFRYKNLKNKVCGGGSGHPGRGSGRAGKGKMAG